MDKLMRINCSSGAPGRVSKFARNISSKTFKITETVQQKAAKHLPVKKMKKVTDKLQRTAIDVVMLKEMKSLVLIIKDSPPFSRNLSSRRRNRLDTTSIANSL